MTRPQLWPGTAGGACAATVHATMLLVTCCEEFVKGSQLAKKQMVAHGAACWQGVGKWGSGEMGEKWEVRG